MRAVAAQLAEFAAQLDGAGSAAPNALPPSAFSGPGRAAHDGAFRSIAQNATMAGRELIDEARQLGRDADRLQREQRDWDRRKREEDARSLRQQQQDRDRAAAAAAARARP